MIKLLNTSTAFLRRGDDYLIMKRAADRKIAPGVYSGIGGKFECQELNDPHSACLREIYEETGIMAGQIHHLSMRYLIIRRHQDVIRQSYVYFGETDAEPSIETKEGELQWVPLNKLLQHRFTETFTAMLTHYMQTPSNERVVVGVAENDSGKCRMVWSTLEGFENHH